MVKDHGKHDSPNAGWPEAAMAGALDLALAGPRRYENEIVDKGWIGEGRARATPGDIPRQPVHAGGGVLAERRVGGGG